MTEWGPNGQVVYERTYSRPMPDGTKETWPETVDRVVTGNLALVYGDPSMWSKEVDDEYCDLYSHILDFKIIPAGRHLWASGVKGRQYLMNCWTSGWTDKLSDHFEFTFMRLMEGGGVGANYSSSYLRPFGLPQRELEVHIVCDPEHPDFYKMMDAGILSDEYNSNWDGAFEVEDSREGWAAALVDLVDTYMTTDDVRHNKRVYDVTNVRPEGARLKTFGGTASGPEPFGKMMGKVAYVLNEAHATTWDFDSTDFCGYLKPLEAMEIDHAIAECVVSGGVRRSARMSIVRWDDPFILEFINCKQSTTSHWTTNISVEIDDEFISQLSESGTEIRTLGGKTVRTTMNRAQSIHAAVVQAMLTNGEPGYWNSSLSNKGEIEPVYATNPCGEITLGEFEACNLGHVNLDAFAPTRTSEVPKTGGLIRAHQLMARFLMRATFGDINDQKSRDIQDRNRRIGVGHLGVQDFIVKQGFKYADVALNTGSPVYHQTRDLLERCYKAVRNEARKYAFELRIPEPIKVTTVAPTGSVSKLPGVGGEGINPVYARYYEQRIRFNVSDPDQAETMRRAHEDGFTVELDVYDKSGNTCVVVYPTKNRLVQQVEDMGYPAENVEQADELTLEAMLAFQAMYQTWYADNAVSFTANVPEGLDQLRAMSVIADKLPFLKGTTVMVDGTREQAPFTRITQAEYEQAASTTLGDGVDEDCATGACPIR